LHETIDGILSSVDDIESFVIVSELRIRDLSARREGRGGVVAFGNVVVLEEELSGSDSTKSRLQTELQEMK